MKRSLLSVGLLTVALTMFSCSQGGLKIGKSNKTFERIPALCIAETGAIQRLNEAAAGTLDGDKKMQYAYTKLEIIADVKKELAIDSAKVMGREVPCTAAEGAGFKATKMTISGWDYSSRSLRIAVQVEPLSADTAAVDSVCYLKSVDHNGTMLDFGAVALKPATSGLEGEFMCAMADTTVGPLADFTAFEQLVLIPAAEYQQYAAQYKAALDQIKLQRSLKPFEVNQRLRGIKPGEIPGLPIDAKPAATPAKASSDSLKKTQQPAK